MATEPKVHTGRCETIGISERRFKRWIQVERGRDWSKTTGVQPCTVLRLQGADPNGFPETMFLAKLTDVERRGLILALGGRLP